MTGRFDRLSLKNFTSEDKAVGAAVGVVLAGAVGLAMINPLAGGDAVAESPAQAAAAGKAGVAGAGKAAGAEATMTLAEARAQGFKVPPHAVKPSEVIDLAEKQVGIAEGKGGMTKFHKWYVSTPHAKATAERDGGFPVRAYNGAQWCNMFVSWLGAQTGVKNMGWDAYTVKHATWFKETDRWGEKPKPGAVVFFDWKNGSRGDIGDIDHVGIVVKDNGDGTVRTIEGNTDNAVKKKVRDKSQIVGYGYPDYAS
ncbi:CHAP domain-containing protein [Actinomadura pelletieri DSM 43383]|uniref:CHAP domain-containing protein n=1 Tax=Actinomadura pelletieri DSM 43383 TaxID=1120940 RepID=A0A495QMR7_9ACTN|nr:CHAP domain-containing protein [Actinomadura pelletieri]RKS74268.1 CHAP domain-containing protein [Actinomadura pelletieri DSM 43383]